MRRISTKVRRRTVALAGSIGLLVTGLATTATPAGAAPSPPPALRVDAPTVDFGSVAVGETSAAITFAIGNDGPGPATHLHVAAPDHPAFEQVATSCGTTLAQGAACTVSVTYSPTGEIPQLAQVGARADGGGSVRIRLSGSPDTPSFPLVVTGTSIDFGPVAVGSTSPTRTVQILNPGPDPIAAEVTGTLGKGPFSTTGTTCPAPPDTIAPGASCTVGYRFRPTTAGPQQGGGEQTVTIEGRPSKIAPLTLLGNGGTTGSPVLRITPRRLDFGEVPIGTLAPPQQVTFTNVSGVGLGQIAVGATDGELERSGTTCGKTLAAGASCTATYRARPAAPGLRTITRSTNLYQTGVRGWPVPIVATVHGTGSRGRLTVDRPSLVLPQGTDGTTPGPTRSLTVRNTGNAPLTGLGLTAPFGFPSGITWTTGCGTVLEVGAACSYTFRYTGGPQLEASSIKVEGSGQSQWIGFSTGRFRSVHEAFVAAAALQLAGSGDPGIPANAAARLDAGTMSRADVVAIGTNSDGWSRAIVTVTYRRAQGGPGDATGVDYWTNQLRTGRRTATDVSSQILGSAKSYAYAGGTAEAWVRRMYLVLLDRIADPGGLAYWTEQVATRGRVSVAARLFDSEQSRRIRVRTQYLNFLVREPDAAGLTYWTGRILREGDTALARQLGSSEECLRVAQSLKSFFP